MKYGVIDVGGGPQAASNQPCGLLLSLRENTHHLRQKSQVQTDQRLFLLHQAEKDSFCLITVCFIRER